MDLPAELAAKLDFSHGKKFRKEVLQLFGSSVHHVEATPSGSFFLLVTFRRFTFRLTEDSVAFALASCLGGAPAGFHVHFLSDRHFRFSVANKSVGFHVYNLRRFIGNHFDAYFYLWSNGAAHWEREKRLWELEQEKEWSKVLSRSQKRIAKSNKKVCFAPTASQRSAFKHPEVQPASLFFGQFKVPIPDQIPAKQSFGSFTRSDPASSSGEHLNVEKACSDSISSNSRGSLLRGNSPACSICLVPGHTAALCNGSVRCRICFNYGHKARWCLRRMKPTLCWKPKVGTERKKPKSNQSADLKKSAAPSTSFCTLENPNPDQSTETVSDEVLGFFRAQRPPIRLELPLVQNHHELVPFFSNSMDKESDYPIFQLAKTMNLHQVFGPSPSAEMLIQDILLTVSLTHHDRYIQRPLSIGLSQFGFVRNLEKTNVDPSPGFIINWRKHLPVISVDPNWGNNWEACSSSTPVRPKLKLIQQFATSDTNRFQNTPDPTSPVLNHTPDGPNISLDQVFEAAAGDDSSSSSSDATSELVGQRARFIAAQNRCANYLIFGRKELPSDVFTRTTAPEVGESSNVANRAITIPASVFASSVTNQSSVTTNTGLEIVPWKPIPQVIALQLLPLVLESRCAPRIILGGPQEEHSEKGPSAFGPGNFEFQTQLSQPSLSAIAGQKHGRGQPRKVLSLPAQASNSPLVESTVRRSSRVCKVKDGFHTPTVKLAEEPSKKRNKIGAVLIDDETGKEGPIPIEILQDWGIKCGIAPAELSQDALLQAPSTDPVLDEDTTA
jgi:hypothetical protein